MHKVLVFIPTPYKPNVGRGSCGPSTWEGKAGESVQSHPPLRMSLRPAWATYIFKKIKEEAGGILNIV